MIMSQCTTWCILMVAMLASRVLGDDLALRFEGHPTGTTAEDFICATMDWWPPDKCDYYWCAWSEAPYGGNPSIPRQDLNQPLLRAALKELSPFTLRLGGSLQDHIHYAFEPSDPCPPLTFNESALFKFSGGCLQSERWKELVTLSKDTGNKVVFGLNELVGRTRVKDKVWTGAWDTSNTRKLLQYTKDAGLEVYGFELGNELGGWNGIAAQLSPREVAEDFLRLSGLLHEIWGPAQAVPKVIGPDNTLDEEWFHEFLTIVGPALNAVTIHLYNLGPGNNLSLPYTILNPNHDAVTIETAANLSRMTATTGHQDMWVGEDGGAYNSGQNQTTNRFISAFWSLTELGTFARAGFKVYCRQTFLGGNYGLVDKDTLKPNPDFFAFLLFKRLMGPTALDVGIQSGEPYVKVFAHCARGVSGGVTLLMLNFDGAREFRISGPTSLLGSGPRHEYLMASPGIVNGTVAYLNGQPLVISDAGAYPKLEPVIKATSDPVVIPPHSYSFTVFPDAKVAACA